MILNTYKEDFERMKSRYAQLAEKYEDVEKKYNEEIVLNTSLAKRLDDLEADLEEFLQRYEQVITCPEYYNEEREAYIAELKAQASRAYGCGRQDAYAEMGIKNIEAHERGNCLAVLENGEVVELITDLETVYDEREDLPDEIVIDDLAEKE